MLAAKRSRVIISNMGNDCISAAWKSSVEDAPALLVLVRLADYANLQGECWPNRGTLARECRLTERGVTKILQRLASAGHITIRKGRGRGLDFRGNSYTVHPCKLSDGGSIVLEGNGNHVLLSGTQVPKEIGERCSKLGEPECKNRGTRFPQNLKEPSRTPNCEPNGSERAFACALDTSTRESDTAAAEKKSTAQTAFLTASTTRSTSPPLRDAALEALARLEGGRVDDTTGHLEGLGAAELARIRRALKEIREASPLLDPAALAGEIVGRAREWGKIFPQATLTANALSKHWAKLRQGQPRGVAAVNAIAPLPWALPERCDWRSFARELGIRITDPDVQWSDLGGEKKRAILEAFHTSDRTRGRS